MNIKSLFRKPVVALLLVSIMIGCFVFVFDLTQVENQKKPRGYFQYPSYGNQQTDLAPQFQSQNSPNNQAVRGLVGKVEIVNMKESFEPKDQVRMKWDSKTIPLSNIFSVEGYVLLVPATCSVDIKFPYGEECGEGGIDIDLQVPSFIPSESDYLYGDEYNTKLVNLGTNDLNGQGLYFNLDPDHVGSNNFLYVPPGLYKIIIGDKYSFLESDVIRISAQKNPTPGRYSLKIGDVINGSVVDRLFFSFYDNSGIYFSGTTTLKGVLRSEEFSDEGGYKEKITLFYPTEKNIPLFSDRPIYLKNIASNDHRVDNTEKNVKIGGYFYTIFSGGEGFRNNYAGARYAEIVP